MNNKLRIIILCACVIFFITIASCSMFHKNENIEFMAKSGTTYKSIDGILSEKNIITSVIGNFKYGNTHYVIYVMLDEPQAIKETFGFQTSGWNAVPTAREITNIIIGEK
ncbi:MAG: hypothetical protein IJW75_06285 [Alphaproteobacteria bacterium]|nr:hypothetical protein [Alphaproteobacteria bacterium]